MAESGAAWSLQNRPLGDTGLLVSPLCFGCAPLGDMPETFGFSVAKEQAHETLKAAFESPVNFLDTAASYGDGEAERRIGEVLQELGGVPSGYVIATKADRNLWSGDFSGEQMRRSIERSLRLLGMDRLPLVYLHDPEHAPFEELMSSGGAVEVLVNLKEERVIEHLGVAGGPVDLMIRYVETGLFEAAITHNRYTLINRTAEPLLDRATELSVPVLNAAPYGSGILAKGPDAYARYAYQEASGELIETVRKMSKVCQEHDVPLAAAALQFSLRSAVVDSTVVGVSAPERIDQTLELAAVAIPDELWDELEQAVPPRDLWLDRG